MSPPSEVENMVRGELEGKLPYPIERAVIRSLPAGTVYADGGEMQERIVIAVARDDLDAYLGMAHKAGLEVVGVDVQACAVVECFQHLLRRESDEDKLTLFVDIGSSSTQVVIARGKKLVFARSLALGGLTLDRELQSAVKIPLEQARQARRRMAEGQAQPGAEDELFRLLDPKLAEIADEIARCLVYYERSFNVNAVDKAVFLGGEANNSRLCQCIARRLNLPATIGDPMAGLRLPQGLEGFEAGKPQPSWAVAIGLSLGAHCAA
jgi:type IV pilus assembly protein PilM